jgi:hypothetical protein
VNAHGIDEFGGINQNATEQLSGANDFDASDDLWNPAPALPQLAILSLVGTCQQTEMSS